MFVVEGVRLAEEALQSGWQPQSVLYSDHLSTRGKFLLEGFSQAGADVDEISPRVMESLSETETSQGILAVFSMRDLHLPEQHPAHLPQPRGSHRPGPRHGAARDRPPLRHGR